MYFKMLLKLKIETYTYTFCYNNTSHVNSSIKIHTKTLDYMLKKLGPRTSCAKKLLFLVVMYLSKYKEN